MADDYLAEGLIEEITHGLAQLEGVRVTQVTSRERIDGAGPSAVLEGIVRQIGNRMRLIVGWSIPPTDRTLVEPVRASGRRSVRGAG